ncbi:MFS efflux transporter [Aspergillus sp. HF37]|nr:MFS efflux transporter [Aspergillus sp. HF37]
MREITTTWTIYQGHRMDPLDLALNNVYCANVGNGTTVLGLLHGGYGVGGTVGSLIATAIASSGIIWPRFYAVAVSLAVLNGVYAGYIFWGYKSDEISGSSISRNYFAVPSTILGALFIFAYQGAEVSISGWIISFLVAA